VSIEVSCKKIHKKQGFTIVEIMVALVILAVGLLGMAGMTVVVMRGSRGAEDLANATNVCQQKIEELKDASWTDLGSKTTADTGIEDLGLINAGMFQEVNLNSQGMSWVQFCTQQSGITGSSCEGQSASCAAQSVDAACKTLIDKAGPYKYTRTFAICSGDNYTSNGTPPDPDPPTGTTTGSAANPSNFTYSAAPNCEVNPSNSTTRPAALACESNDILTIGDGSFNSSPEKMIKILCTWRTKEGRCSYVNFEALRMNNL
jgi:prepilin-type N-terminal cleavage/methylation domain-containing protein